MLVQSFVPPSETRFRADIVRLFKRENFVNSTINTAAGAGPIGAGPIGAAGAAGAAGGVRGAGLTSTNVNAVPAANSTYPSYYNATSMGAGRVSSGVNWVNAEYSAQPAYPSTTGGTSSGSSATTGGAFSAKARSDVKDNAHVLNALDEVIAQDSGEEDQPGAETVLGAPKEQNAKNSHSADDNASSHSDSDSNADEEEEEEEEQEEESSGDEKDVAVVDASGTHLLLLFLYFLLRK